MLTPRLFAMIGFTSILPLTFASAADLCVGGPKDQWLQPDEVKERVIAMGYKDFVLAFEDGCYEAKIKEGSKRIEIYMDPVTGEVAKVKEE